MQLIPLHGPPRFMRRVFRSIMMAATVNTARQHTMLAATTSYRNMRVPSSYTSTYGKGNPGTVATPLTHPDDSCACYWQDSIQCEEDGRQRRDNQQRAQMQLQARAGHGLDLRRMRYSE